MTFNETNLEIDRAYHVRLCNEAMATIPNGPWNKEPHFVEFKHAGLDCILKRVSSRLHWCGYIALTKDHPYYGKSYNEIDPECTLEVHGGLTYSDACNETICHKTETNDEVWWLGFDCGHYQDLSPGSLKWMPESIFEKHYWTVEEVKLETMKIAAQLGAIK